MVRINLSVFCEKKTWTTTTTIIIASEEFRINSENQEFRINSDGIDVPSPALLIMGLKDYFMKFPGMEDYIRKEQ